MEKPPPPATHQEPAVARGVALLRCAATFPEDLARGALLVITALVRPWELVASTYARGVLHVPAIRCRRERSVPLSTAAAAILGAGPGAVLGGLGVSSGEEAGFLGRIQRELEDRLATGLESAWVSALEALVVSAPSRPEREAVFAYAGVGAMQAPGGLLTVVPALIDRLVAAAGLEVPSTTPAA